MACGVFYYELRHTLAVRFFLGKIVISVENLARCWHMFLLHCSCADVSVCTFQVCICACSGQILNITTIMLNLLSQTVIEWRAVCMSGV